MTRPALVIPSPVGKLTLVADNTDLCAILWESDDEFRVAVGPITSAENHPILVMAAGQINEYFDRKRTQFQLPLRLEGTEFQRAVWEALREIPYGETRSYGEIARRIGRPKASRAVGAANARNPISIVIPCHRVIGASGSLTGFAGGMEAKSLLLGIERHA